MSIDDRADGRGIRIENPEERYRRGRFELAWGDAAEGTEYRTGVVQDLTWQSLGWRLGAMLGDATDEQKRAVYSLLVEIRGGGPDD